MFVDAVSLDPREVAERALAGSRARRHSATLRQPRSEELAAKRVDLRVLDQQIDTTTGSGKFMFHILAAVAEFERDLIRERTNAGLAATKARGRQGCCLAACAS